MSESCDQEVQRLSHLITVGAGQHVGHVSLQEEAWGKGLVVVQGWGELEHSGNLAHFNSFALAMWPFLGPMHY